jgi:hypothetical protein
MIACLAWNRRYDHSYIDKQCIISTLKFLSIHLTRSTHNQQVLFWKNLTCKLDFHNSLPSPSHSIPIPSPPHITMPSHAYLITREFMPESHSIQTCDSIRIEPHPVFHCLDNAKQYLQSLRNDIVAAEPTWDVEASHKSYVGGERLTGFTVRGEYGNVRQVAWIGWVRLGDDCS